MYDNILLCIALQGWTTPSPHAVAARDAAIALAKGTTDHLNVLTVFQYNIAMQGTSSRDDQMERIDRQMETKMRQFVTDIREAGVSTTELIWAGNARKLIIDVSQDIEADIIVMGAHSKRNIFDIGLGGTASHIARLAPCPVLMISPREHQ